jgi:hypothetical protein
MSLDTSAILALGIVVMVAMGALRARVGHWQFLWCLRAAHPNLRRARPANFSFEHRERSARVTSGITDSLSFLPPLKIASSIWITPRHQAVTRAALFKRRFRLSVITS